MRSVITPTYCVNCYCWKMRVHVMIVYLHVVSLWHFTVGSYQRKWYFTLMIDSIKWYNTALEVRSRGQ